MNVARWFLGTLAALLLLLVMVGAALYGAFFNVLYLLLPAGCGIGIVCRIVGFVRRDITFRLIKEPAKRDTRPYWFQLVIRCAFWILAGGAVQVAVVPEQFSSSDYLMVTLTVWSAVVLLVGMSVIPLRFIYWPINVAFAIFAIVCGWQIVAARYPSSENAVALSSPTREPWLVMHGTGAFLTNHHHFAGSQKFAMDSIPEADGVKIGNTDLEIYDAFGADLLAPCDGEVIEVEASLPDQPIGGSDLNNLAGNYLIIKKEEGVFVLLAHMKNGSAAVKPGDVVKAGQVIGQCGNSGNSSQPHLHLQAMTKPDLLSDESEPLRIMINGAIPRRKDRL